SGGARMSAPPLSLSSLLPLAGGPENFAHAIARVPQGLVRYVRIPLRSLRLCVSEQLADDVKRYPVRYEMRGEAVAEIVNANLRLRTGYGSPLSLESKHIRQAGGLAYLHPRPPQSHARLSVRAREQRTCGAVLALHFPQQVQGRGTQRDMLNFLFFRVVARFCPDAALQIELRPLRFQYLAFAGASQQQQAQRVGRVLVGVCIKGFCESVQLLFRQPSFALVFLKPGDATRGVGAHPFPFRCQGEHLGEQSEHAIRLVRRGLERGVQRLQVTFANGLEAQRAERRANDVVNHLPVVTQAGCALVRHYVALKVFRRQLIDCGLGAVLLSRFQGIISIHDPYPQLHSALARRARRQLGIAADGIAPLAAVDPILQNKRNNASAGDPHPESRHFAVPCDPAALLRGLQFRDNLLEDSAFHRALCRQRVANYLHI